LKEGRKENEENFHKRTTREKKPAKEKKTSLSKIILHKRK